MAEESAGIPLADVLRAGSVGRHKDFARIEQIMEQTDGDKNLLETILKCHKLSLPKQ